MKKLISILVILVIISAMSFSGAEARQLKIGMNKWIGSAIVNIADVKGFWKELGLDALVVVYETDTDMRNAFNNKKNDMTNDMLGTYVASHAEGKNLKIIAVTDWSHGGDKVIIKKDLDLAKAKGEKIGVYVNTPAVTFFLEKFLAKNGSKLGEWQLAEVDTADLAKQFNANKLKLTVNYDPEALSQEKDGNGKVLATSADFPGCIPEGFALLDETLKEVPKEDIVKFLKGLAKASDWARDEKNLAELTKIVNEKTFGGAKYTDAEVKGMLATIKFHDKAGMTDIHKAGGSLEQYLTEVNAFMKDNKLSAKEFKPADIYDPSFVTESLK